MKAKAARCIILSIVLIAAAFFVRSYIIRKNIEENYPSPISELYIGPPVITYEYEATVVSKDDERIVCRSVHDYVNDNYGGRYNKLSKDAEMILYTDEADTSSIDSISRGDTIHFMTTGPEDIDDKGRLIMDSSDIKVV